MTPTEQPHSSLPTITSINQSPYTEANDVAHSPNPQFDDMHQYNTSPANRTYSPVPGAHDNGVLYSPSSYNQQNSGIHHHQAAILSSPPPFFHSVTGSPSPSTTTSRYSNHYQHYTNATNFALTSLVPQTQQLPPPSSHHTMRTVYLGNIPPDTHISDILDQVRSGVLESARLLPEKNCVFLTFADPGAAAHFYHQVSHRPLTLNGIQLKVGWGKPSDVSTHLRLALQNGASRNVFLGSLNDTVNEEGIREDLKQFGTIENVRLLVEKKIAFVHFLSIADAIKCVNQLPNQVEWQNRRIFFGRDRCCPNLVNVNATNTTNALLSTPPSSYHPHYYSPHPHPIHVQHHAYQVRYSPSFTYGPYTGTTVESYAPTTTPPPPPHHQVHHHHHHHHQPSTTAHVILPSPLAPPLTTSMHGNMATGPTNTSGAALYPPLSQHHYGTANSLEAVANRTVYLGNIHPEATCEDICNVVRGGILSQIRYIVDKHIAFLVFVDPAQALQFYTQANTQGMVIKSRRLKLGWGKPSSLAANILQAVHSGGSRNVYLGNMDGDTMDEDKLKHDFSEYGEIELVNTLKEKNCAFINFTSIAAAIRAIEGIRTKEEYQRFRINYGKDRCGNPPRPPPTGLQKTTSGQSVESTTTTPTSSSASSSTTNSVTTPPTSCSNITQATTSPNQEGTVPLTETTATPTFVNGLEVMPTTFPSSTSAYNMAPLTDLMADLTHPDIVTDVPLN